MSSLILSYRYPGKYAFNVLAGALETDPVASTVPLFFPRTREALHQVVRERVAAGEHPLVAWSFYSPGADEAAEELRWLRAELGASFTALAGGVHASAEPLATLRSGFDRVAVGEGEQTMVELARRLVEGQPLDGIRGTARLEGDALLSFGRAEPVDLNGFPAGSARWRKFGAIEITRGCIYACKFCQTPFMNRAKFRHRSVERICETVRQMKAIGMRDVRFISPTSLSYGSPDESVNLAAVEELLARLRETAGPSMRLYFGTFPSEVRPEHVTPEALTVLRRYVDNDNLILGGQSGSESVLAKSHRGHDVEAIIRAARIAAECGFVPNVDFILGLPGEAEEEISQTVALMRKLAALGARVHSHTFMPLPGTPFKDAPPGRVSAETAAALQALAGDGLAYGQWRKQVSIAEAIARRRRT